MKENPKVIALSCSPSRGYNSDSMLNAFIEGFKSKSGKTIEKIYLSDVPMDDYSFENKMGPLEHETAFKELCDKVQQAEALIIATPTYNFSVPARLKNFIDRIRFFALDFQNKSRLHQPGGKLSSLRVYFIVSGGTPTWAQKLLFFAFPPFWLRGVFLYFGSHCLGAIYTGNVKAYQTKEILDRCRQRGERFAVRLEKGHENAILERIFFRPPQV
jgi:FMN-dependent NADH-azoreductase